VIFLFAIRSYTHLHTKTQTNTHTHTNRHVSKIAGKVILCFVVCLPTILGIHLSYIFFVVFFLLRVFRRKASNVTHTASYSNKGAFNVENKKIREKAHRTKAEQMKCKTFFCIKSNSTWYLWHYFLLFFRTIKMHETDKSGK
jgi:hypothetical protein